MSKWVCRLWVAILAFGCGSTANPRSCIDGSCTDSRYPYCDVEGLFEEPQTCVEVTCAPGEIKGCRGDLAITCNTAGNNFDLVACPNGCDETGCIAQVDCTSNAQCTNPAPICGQDMTCRGCSSDDECGSTVCELDTGACTAETAVVYASPTGSQGADCSLATPCSLTRALQLVTVGATGKTLRLIPGEYSSDLAFSGNVIVNVVATGATLTGTAKVTVLGGAAVSLRGLTITSTADPSVDCGDSIVGATLSRVSLLDVMGTRYRSAKCSARIVGGTVLALSTYSTDVSIDADRVRFTFAYASAFGQRVSIRILNSIFSGGIDLGSTSDTTAPGSSLSVGFSTFALKESGAIVACDGNTSNYVRSVVFENNILFAAPTTGTSSVVIPRQCQFKNNLLYPQATTVGTSNIVMDPLFVDLSGGDYHLQPNSPAKDVGQPSVGLSPSQDFDRVSRPQGTAPDLGAFELVP